MLLNRYDNLITTHYEKERIDMRSSRLGMVGRFVLALLMMLMLGALVAAAAQAEPTRALEWKVEGKVLKANETREIVGKASTILEIESPTQKIRLTCEEASVSRGSFLANQNGQAVSESNDIFSKCRVEGNGEKCTKVREPIETKKVKTEFVLNDLKPGIGNKILGEAFPAAGLGKEFVELKFEGTGCRFANTIIKGSVLGSLWTDPKADGGSEEEIELGKLPPETTSYLIKSPDPNSSSVWLWNGSKFELVEPPALTAFSEDITRTGTGLVSLATAEKFGLTETGK